MEMGITDKEFEESDERRREEILLLKQTKKIRITSGGSFKDFEDLNLSIIFLKNQSFINGYASINIIYPEMFLHVRKDIPNNKRQEIEQVLGVQNDR